jgi:dipeptide/tripeptide permease
MSSSTPPARSQDPNRWPRQVRFILGNEAAERFSYYGMRGILALYITNVLLQTKDYATEVIHLFGTLNYFTPLLGAWVADRLWGRYHTILWISLSYCAGHGVMALSDFIPTTDGKLICLWVGLFLIAFGAGGIKPCVSAFMGDQFRPDQQHLLQKAYAAFYWSINLGSTASFFVIPFIRKSYGYSWAFGVPGLAMALATLVFWLGTRHYVRVQPAGDKKWLWKVFWVLLLISGVWLNEFLCRKAGLQTALRLLIDAVIIAAIVAWVTRKFLREADQETEVKHGAFFAVFWYAINNPSRGGSFWGAARQKFTATSVNDAISVWRILSIFALVPIFWALFEQTFSTWVLQAEKMESHFFASDSGYGSLGLRNPRVMAEKINAHTNAVTTLLWNRLSETNRPVIANSSTNKAVLKKALLTELNKVIKLGGSIYESNRFHGVSLCGEAQLLIGKVQSQMGSADPASSNSADVALLNRLLLDDSFPNETMTIYRIGPEEMLSMNPILVMILLPIMTLLVYPPMGRLATPLRRMSCGMFLAGASYLIVAAIQSRIDGGQTLSIWWQTAPYIVITIAEILVSTTGLEFAFREAAPSMKSTIIGFWYLTVSVGNLFVTLFTKLAGAIFGGGSADAGQLSLTPTMFLFYAGLTLVFAVIFSIVATFYKYRDPSAALGK